jgi:hypothetical protein
LVGCTVCSSGLLTIYLRAGTPIVNKLEDLYSLLCVPLETVWVVSQLMLASENSLTSRLGRVTRSFDRRLTSLSHAAQPELSI